MSELAAHAVLTPSGLTRLVDKLVREGLVRRDKCDADARVVYAVLTPAQKAQLATMRSEREARREQWKEFRKSHPAPAASTAQ